MALGAGVGAAASATMAAPGERRGAALRGALLGGGAGLTLGGLGRAYRDTKLLQPSLQTTGQRIGATAARMGRGVTNFANRQIHGLTGHMNHDAIGMAGNATAARKARLLRARMADDIAHAAPVRADAITKGYQGQIKGVLEEGREAQHLADAGVTHLPGLVRALGTRGKRVQAFKAMGKAVSTPLGLGLGVGLPVAMSVPELRRGDESAHGGHTMGQKLRHLGSNVAGGIAFAGMPIIPQMALGIAADSAAAGAPANPSPPMPRARSRRALEHAR